MTLKELRKQLNLTQEECAKALGVPLRTYQNYERDDVNTQSIKYRFLFEKLQQIGLVDDEHGILTVDKIKQICEPILTEHKVKYCYLFGSYAKGNATESSDVDLFVSTELSGMLYFELVESLREGLKKKVDVLNQNQIKDNFELVNEILQDGIKIYG
ncbi:MAG: nucleotidyltransferase domain-containing protein [Clostridia bacterium]|nr:nucleotidyltransferase domain-containing protein [Clostridia bacterium]